MIGQLLAAAIAATAITFHKELSGKRYQTVVYDQKLSDIFDLAKRAEHFLKIRKLNEACSLIDQQLKIDDKHPTPYAQLGQYYQFRALDHSGTSKFAFVEKSLESYNIASQLADIFTPTGKVLPTFKPLVTKQIGIVLTMRARCKLEIDDITGAIEDYQASLKYNLDSDVRKEIKELLHELQSSVL